MNHTILLDKLIQIQRAIGVESNFTVQNMLMEAEDCLLQIEKEMVESLRKHVNQPVSDASEQPILSEYQAKSNSLTLASDSKALTSKSQIRESAKDCA